MNVTQKCQTPHTYNAHTRMSLIQVCRHMFAVENGMACYREGAAKVMAQLLQHSHDAPRTKSSTKAVKKWKGRRWEKGRKSCGNGGERTGLGGERREERDRWKVAWRRRRQAYHGIRHAPPPSSRHKTVYAAPPVNATAVSRAYVRAAR